MTPRAIHSAVDRNRQHGYYTRGDFCSNFLSRALSQSLSFPFLLFLSSVLIACCSSLPCELSECRALQEIHLENNLRLNDPKPDVYLLGAGNVLEHLRRQMHERGTLSPTLRLFWGLLPVGFFVFCFRLLLIELSAQVALTRPLIFSRCPLWHRQ